MWILAGVAQEAAEESAAAANARQEREVALGGDSTAAADAAREGAGEDAPTAADTDGVEAGAGEAESEAGEPARAFPEIAPLDELFIPSLGLRADESWDDMPVDF